MSRNAGGFEALRALGLEKVALDGPGYGQTFAGPRTLRESAQQAGVAAGVGAGFVGGAYAVPGAARLLRGVMPGKPKPPTNPPMPRIEPRPDSFGDHIARGVDVARYYYPVGAGLDAYRGRRASGASVPTAALHGIREGLRSAVAMRTNPISTVAQDTYGDWQVRKDVLGRNPNLSDYFDRGTNDKVRETISTRRRDLARR